MSYAYDRAAGPREQDDPAAQSRGWPGKRTLVESLQPRGGGEGLPREVRGKMEQSFGADFSSVRVHQGSEALSLGARAVTRGSDIFFAPGEYDPSSRAGQELLGHELTHVIQQRSGRATPQGKGGAINADAGLEAEADTMGSLAARGERAHVHGVTTGNPGTGGVMQCKTYAQCGVTQAAQMDSLADNLYYQRADAYEQALGVAAFADPNANAAAFHMVDRVATMVEGVAQNVQTNGRSQQQQVSHDYDHYFGNQDRGSTGTIGPSQSKIREVRANAANSNLREKMTLVFTARNDIKALFAEIEQHQNYVPNQVGQDVHNAFQHYSAQHGGDHLPPSPAQVESTRLEQWGQTYDIPPHYWPTDTEILELDQQGHETGTRHPKNQKMNQLQDVDVRVRETDPNNLPTDETPNTLHNRGLGLSYRELKAQFFSRDKHARKQQMQQLRNTGELPPKHVWNGMNAQQRAQALRGLDGDRRLEWVPGERYYSVRQDSQYAIDARRNLELIAATGSGTADFMLKIARYCGITQQNDLLATRLACVGWMVPARDHTYREILLAAAANGAGAPPAVGPALYQDITPLQQNAVFGNTFGPWPWELHGVLFKDVLAAVFYPDNPLQRANALAQAGIAPIQGILNALLGTFQSVASENDVQVVTAAGIPLMIAEKINDPGVLNALVTYIQTNQVNNLNQLSDALNLPLYANLRNLLDRDRAYQIFAILARNRFPMDVATQHLTSTAGLLDPNDVRRTQGNLGFSQRERDRAWDHIDDAHDNYGPHDRGVQLDRHAFDHMHRTELLSIRDYTGSAAREWNEISENPRNPLDNHMNVMDLDQVDRRMHAAKAGLHQMAVYAGGSVFRGEYGKPLSAGNRNAALQKYAPGAIVAYRTFLSTGKTVDDSFIPDSGVAIVIDNVRTGRDVQLVSKMDHEREVLFPPEAKFVVTRVDDRSQRGTGTGPFEKLWVYMKEL